jgi:hypothetical protein
MTTPPPESGGVLALRALLIAQPWYKKVAKGITAAVGAASLIVWLLVSAGVEISDDVTAWVTGAIAVLTVLGVYEVPNGITEREVARAERLSGLRE